MVMWGVVWFGMYTSFKESTDFRFSGLVVNKFDRLGGLFGGLDETVGSGDSLHL